MKVKQFDCVEMKRLNSQKIYEEIKNMDMMQELIYWQKADKKAEKLQNESLDN